jgi:hypothetical protein
MSSNFSRPAWESNTQCREYKSVALTDCASNIEPGELIIISLHIYIFLSKMNLCQVHHANLAGKRLILHTLYSAA